MPKTSARLLSLLSLLQARRDWPGGLLAERLDVSPRTVRRDVDRLRELGYPIRAFKGPDGGYRLDAGAQLPPLLFDDEQAVAIAVALRLASVSGADIQEGAVRALNTMRQVMPSRLRRRIDSLEVTAVEQPTTRPDCPVDSTVLTAIGAAVHAHDGLCFDYASATADTDAPPRRVEPHHLVTWNRRWYLVGWDLDRDDWRTFRVDRISPRTPTGPRFTPRQLPTADVATFITGRFRGSTDTPAWPCVGEVILDLPATVVAAYTRDGLVEGLGPDRCKLVQGSWSWAGLAAALGRFDADIEVIGPAELKAAFAGLARRYASASG
ncbi:helix-turn-helix transcriptional regulator [Micromonospora sp. LH3U1]|uniref:helix-turn-helix transcriptional regulator n=1 Tax=Micromonospora sp. LH3U1 TaxID=3018339 RepID=UPI00234B633B|nr:WYL domain-containing protein [Micromonospora sp. LH3U1]WCN80566.1 WYL domain-containing protein [Micromonospora sp. LH3U1]